MKGSKVSCFILMVMMARFALATEPSRWQGNVPDVAKEFAPWKLLITELKDRKMYYGVMAAAARVLVYFSDFESKEFSFRTIVDLIDLGYPQSAQSYFYPGDLTPQGDFDFSNSYNLYKAVLNQRRGVKKWADYYFSQVDQKTFAKYLFYDALETYSKRDLVATQEKLKKILQTEVGPEKLPFVTRVIRTLARVYFDQEEYEKSFDIYSSFLLKLNPVVLTDYVEAAWGLYYLKRYQESLGLLYNLESESMKSGHSLEWYSIRGLIYRNLCAVGQAESLLESFNRDFGTTLDAIKHGVSYSQLEQLNQIDIPETIEYRQTLVSMDRLTFEETGMSDLPEKLKPLAIFLYDSEIKMLGKKNKLHRDVALNAAARQLMMKSEQIRFMRYDVAREKFNPDIVFRGISPPLQGPRFLSLEGNSYEIHWNQFGDFWRDERTRYRGSIQNQCYD